MLGHLNLKQEIGARAASTLLLRNGISHQVCVGEAHGLPGGQLPYFWIRLDDGNIVDVSLINTDGLPDTVSGGIFAPAQWPAVQYQSHFDSNPEPLTAEAFLNLCGLQLSSYPLLSIGASANGIDG